MTDAWIEGVGPEGRRFEAPREAGGGWVRLRPLTWRETLHREALTCSEEFEVDAAGVVSKVLRRYDAEAGTRYDLRQCLVCGQLPPVGSVTPEGVSAELVERLLEELPPVARRWLEGCLEEINLRRPEDRARLEELRGQVVRAARQACGGEGGTAAERYVDLRELEVADGPEGASLREGRDFRTQSEWQTQRPRDVTLRKTNRPLLYALLGDSGFTGQEAGGLSAQPAWWTELALAYRSGAGSV